MSCRIIATIAFLAFAVSSCATTGSSDNPIRSRWVGRSAGEFFAKYNPPISDTAEGSSTIYNWRGGYKRIKTFSGGSASVSCSAKLTVSENYTIRDITVVSDRPGATGPSYCTELLGAS